MKWLSAFAKPKSARIGLAALVLMATPYGHATETCSPPAQLSGSGHLQNSSGYQALGAWFTRAGDAHCAVEAYRHAASLAPTSPRLHYLLGAALYASGDSEQAATELRRSIDLDPSFTQAHLALGVVQHDRGKQTEALEEWETVVRLDPASATALDWIVKTRIEAKQYTAAVDLLRTAPDTEDLAIDRVVAYSKAAFYEEAATEGEKTIARHPDWLRERMAVATVLVQRSRYQEAVVLLHDGLQTAPAELDLQILYLRVLVLMGDLNTAVPYATDFLKQHPDNFDALYLSGLLDRQDGDYAMALAHLNAAEVLQPNHYDVHFNLGATLAKLHRPEEAKLELEKAIAMDDSNPEVHFQLAGVLRSLDDTVGAKRELAIYEQRLHGRALHDQQMSLAAQAAQKLAAGDAAGAVDAENEILKISPEDAIPYYNLSLALDRLGDFAGERAALQHAVLLRPDLAAAYNQLGYLAVQSNDQAAAEDFFRKAIASAPQYAEAESNLGSLLAKQGKDVEAEQYFRTAVAANPRYTDAWINLAASLAARSQFADARQAVLSALRVDPGNADATQLLSMLPPAEGASKP